MKKQAFYLFLLLALIACRGSGSSETTGTTGPYCDVSNANPVPAFGYIQNGWLPNKDRFCAQLKINAPTVQLDACAYSILSNPYQSNSYSSHFAPNSRFYQGWRGIQIVASVNGAPVPVRGELFIALTQKDYQRWLAMMGFKGCSAHVAGKNRPLCAAPEQPANKPKCIGKDAQGICNLWEYSNVYRPFSDVGNNNPQKTAALLKVPAAAWQGVVDSYSHQVKATTYYRIWYDKCKNLIAAYGTCTEYKKLNDTKWTNYCNSEMKNQIDKMNKSVQLSEGSCKIVKCGE